MSSSAVELVGSRVSRYRLLEEVGKGGVGTVYLAEVLEPGPELEPGDRVAVKIVHPHLLATDEALEVLEPLRDGAPDLALEDRLAALDLGRRLELGRGNEEGARAFLERAEELLSRAEASLPVEFRAGFREAAARPVFSFAARD